MRVIVNFEKEDGADALYSLQAPGYCMAALKWANDGGILEDWTTIALIALDPFGHGAFRYKGGRAIPPEATRVAAELIAADFEQRKIVFFDIPAERRCPSLTGGVRFGVLSDLHMSNKPGRILRALRLLNGVDCVLLPGDMTNDAAPEQFERMRHCIEAELENVPVLSVAGNHDFPVKPLPIIPEGIGNYGLMENWLLDRARRLGIDCDQDASGAYSASFRGIDIIGLNAVSHWRRFVFPNGNQLRWLSGHFEQSAASHHIVMCHAPLLGHNPARESGRDPAYLSRDDQLQQILDAHRRILLLSGHTHISLNDLDGCAEYDEAWETVYLNDSSVVPTTLRKAESLHDEEWVDGAVVQFRLSGREIEVMGRSISSGKKIARAYYRFKMSGETSAT